jgi:DNA-binding transcriptional ArsR family regulator
MARLATTADAFNAIAEPRRRDILNLLARGEKNVNEVVAALGIIQPRVSKHLAVLKKVGLVSVHNAGRHRVYRLNGERLKPVHDWVKTFERFWEHQLEQVKKRAEEKMKTRGSTS